MDSRVYTLAGIAVYVFMIVLLMILGKRYQKSLESFAIGNRKDSPVLVGLSLAANMTSAATFVINPGLVYLYGLSGFLGYAIAAPAGIFTALVVLSKRFRLIGDQYRVLTIPQWIGERFSSRTMRMVFGLISLLQITFIVLIAVGLTVVLARVLLWDYRVVLILIILFTLSYIMLGGASIHILTNSFQSFIMITVAVLMLISGPLFADVSIADLFDRLARIDPVLTRATNPASILFRDWFEVFVANFIVGVAIICQPHILSKALYLRSEKDVNTYLMTTILVGTLFFLVLFTGLYARVALQGNVLPPDQSMAQYIATVFPPPVMALVTLGILAAGFSTLEGLFLALSTIFSIDIVQMVVHLKERIREEEKRNAIILKISRVFLIVLAVIVYVLSVDQITNPSLSVAIFAQNGVYGLFVATFYPIFTGIFFPGIRKGVVFTASMAGLLIHFGMYYGKVSQYHTNPGVCAAFALIVSGMLLVLISVVFRRRTS